MTGLRVNDDPYIRYRISLFSFSPWIKRLGGSHCVPCIPKLMYDVFSFPAFAFPDDWPEPPASSGPPPLLANITRAPRPTPSQISRNEITAFPSLYCIPV